MADLDFSHNVAQIPAGESLPESKRSVGAEVAGVPDYQSAVSNYAASTNWMSSLGSSVAASASNAIATRLGGQAGLNPHGDLLPPLTDFDKTFSDAYKTQSESTLGLKANQLITDSNITMSQAVKITPDLIASTNKQISIGLQNIFKDAPAELRPGLESQYGHMQQQQSEHLVARMVAEKKEDRQNLVDASGKMYTQNAYSSQLAGTDLDANGDSKSALAAEASLKRIYDSAVAMRDKSPLDKQIAVDGARQSRLSAKYINQAIAAQKAGKEAEFGKKLADNPPKDISATDHDAVFHNVMAYVQQQNALRSENESLQTAMMDNRILTEPDKITGAEWNAYAQNVSPVTQEKTKFRLLDAIKKERNTTLASQTLSKFWDNPTALANADPKLVNKTFNDKVKYIVEKSNTTDIPLKSPTPISADDAEVMVASGAGGEIPVFTKSLQNKLKSSNPANIESGINQIHKLMQNGNGQALAGLNDQDWSMFSAAQALRDSPDPIKANQEAHDRIYNQDGDVEKMNKTKWSNILTKTNAAGIPNDVFALKTFGMSKSDFLNQTLASAYGTNILTKFSNFFAISGDYDEAKASTQRWVDENYGDTYINGGKHKTLHPIEKRAGFSTTDGVPFIQQNIADQLNEKLKPVKEAYDKKTGNEYWEVLPIKISEKASLEPGKESKSDINKTLASSFNLKAPEQVSGQEMKESLKNNRTIASGLASHHEDFPTPNASASTSHGAYFKTYDPIKIQRHMRTANGMKTDTFNVVLIGNAFGDYDVSIQAKSGMFSLYREAPYLGIMSVSPQNDVIQQNFNRAQVERHNG